MQQRQLGSQGLTVSAVGLGTMGMTQGFGMPGVYGLPDEGEAVATIHRALELGVNFFDTAEIYGPFVNEELLGRALRGKRAQAIIATKFGFQVQPSGEIVGLDSSPQRIRDFVDESLKRLQTDYIDLLYQHRLDPNTPIEETVGAMAEVVQAGKARFLGLSEVSPKTIRRAHATAPISALQTEYSLWERTPEAEILPTVRELGIGFVPYSPLGRGFLTGDVKPAEEYGEDDYRRMDPRLQGENFVKNKEILDAIRRLGMRLGLSPAKLALAWLLHQGQDLVPIPGTKRRSRLEENVAAAQVHLPREILQELEQLAPVGSAAGQRYREDLMATIDQG
jgi:aryl-alcohol dehydrogenase-like predicted oxidoreductase